MVNKHKNSHCFLCYKPAAREFELNDQNETTYSRNKQKFVPLLFRHLKLQLDFNKIKKEFLCCEDCLLLGESFCDLFFQLECIQLQLNSKLQKLYDGMVYAGRIPSRVIAFRTQFDKLDEDEEETEFPSQIIFSEIQVARNNLIKRCGLKLKSGNPRVLLTRISDPTDNPTEIINKIENQPPTTFNSTFLSSLPQPTATDSSDISKESCVYDDGDTEQKLFKDEFDNQNCYDYNSAKHIEEHNQIDNQLATFSNSTLGFEENISEIDIEHTQTVIKDDPNEMEAEEDEEENINNLERENLEYFRNSKTIDDVSQKANSSKPSKNKRIGQGRRLRYNTVQCGHCPTIFTHSTTMNLHLKRHEDSFIANDKSTNSDYDSDDYIKEHDLNGKDFAPFPHPNQHQPILGTSSKMEFKSPEIPIQKLNPTEMETREEQAPQKNRLPKVNGNGPKDFKCSVEGCNRVYKVCGSLTQHVKLCHTPNVPTMECSHCKRAFKMVGQLNRHLRIVHRVQVPKLKDLCKESHPHHCVICQREYGYRKDVYRHIRKNHVNVDESEIVCCCGKKPNKKWSNH